MKEIVEQILQWWVLICIFPGGFIGIGVSALYDNAYDTDHDLLGALYWPILLIVMIVKSVINWFTQDTYSGHDDYFW